MRYGAGVIITNKERNLFYLQLKDYEHPINELRKTYVIFGGAIEEGENPKAAIKRELSEELDKEALEIVNKNIKFIFKDTKKNRHGPYKGHLQEFHVFESVLPEQELVRISKLPVKEGKKGVLIKKDDFSKKNIYYRFQEIFKIYYWLKK